MADRFATLRHGLVGAWCPSLKESGYLLRDRSGRNNHATLNTAQRFEAVTMALSLVTNNTTATARTTVPISGNAALSWSLWFRPVTADMTGLRIFGNLGAQGTGTMAFPCMNAVANGDVCLSFGGAFVNSSSILSAGNWYHLVGTKSPGTVSGNTFLYLNGISLSVSDFSPLTVPNISAIAPTISGGPLGSQFNGAMDDVRIYNRVLTPAEVRLLASQRGIGLLPTRHRRGSLLSQFWLNVAGTWKTAKPWINVGGTWKVGSPKIRAGGAWKG